MELLLSLVIIHGQMFRINFFFVSFFSHFFLLWPLAMLCILISWIWTNFSPYLASTTAFSKFFTVKIVFRYLIGSKWRCFTIKELIIVKMDSSNTTSILTSCSEHVRFAHKINLRELRRIPIESKFSFLLRTRQKLIRDPVRADFFIERASGNRAEFSLLVIISWWIRA